MSEDLIPIEDITESVFTAGGVAELLERITPIALSIVPDTSTDNGRKAITSQAYAVTRTKTKLDDIGKAMVKPLKAKVKLIDDQRKVLRESMTLLARQVKAPLLEWERVEDDRKAEIAKRVKAIRDMAYHDQADTPEETLALVRSLHEDLLMLEIDESFEHLQEDAIAARDLAGTLLMASAHELELGIERRAKADAEASAAAEIKRIQEEADKRVGEALARAAAAEAKEVAPANAVPKEVIPEEPKIDNMFNEIVESISFATGMDRELAWDVATAIKAGHIIHVIIQEEK